MKKRIATAMLAAGKDFLARAVARGELTPSLADGHANELPDTVKKVMMAPGQSPANKATPGTKP